MCSQGAGSTWPWPSPFSSPFAAEAPPETSPGSAASWAAAARPQWTPPRGQRAPDREPWNPRNIGKTYRKPLGFHGFSMFSRPARWGSLDFVSCLLLPFLWLEPTFLPVKGQHLHSVHLRASRKEDGLKVPRNKTRPAHAGAGEWKRWICVTYIWYKWYKMV